ncbi:hypothetical protein [Leucobacter sp. GX24907]
MAIRESIVVDIAEVQATDDYRVELRQERKRTTYTTSQARDLALELIEAAERVDLAYGQDMADLGERLTAGVIRTDDGEVVL